ncbi:MAG: FAD-binding oxidoreductase [Intrasporangium sp.]|uniref:FAD-binding oxidoreductase n=1 Tax=Intrasporangium sp. TaxID=1925024 RepID=UPI0026495432|nr:FAD-binding oxidoreductase [Intrasporangium sp.]MDN5794157.1 FAD-binding oxidoreductase [Intrasporangium sp.]
MPLAPLPDEDVPFVLAARRWCTPVVAELTLEPAAEQVDFVAGQYVLAQDGDRTVPVRSYSVANAPRPDGRLTLLVTAVPDGPTSTWLARESRIGDRLLVSGPYGTFVADPGHHGPTLYLAGGSGLAPVRSLLEEAVAQRETQDRDAAERHTLLFSGRTLADVIDETELDELARSHPWLDYVRTLTRVASGSAAPPLGRVPEILPGLLPDLGGYAVYIAGSPGFVDACTRTVQRLGVHAGRLHTEEFYAEPVPWHGAGAAAPTPTIDLEESS